MKIYLRGCALSIVAGVLAGAYTFATTPDQGIRLNYPVTLANFTLVTFSGIALSGAIALWKFGGDDATP